MKNFVKFIVWAFTVLVFNTAAAACPWCRAQVRNGIYDQDFFSNLFVMLLPIFILTAIGFGLYHADKIKHKIGRLK